MSMNIPEVPYNMDDPNQLYDFLTAVRNALMSITDNTPPRAPSNLIVTPVALGNFIQFTRSDVDSYLVYASPSSLFSSAVVIPIGSLARYTDYVGQSGITKFYWVAALKGTQVSTIIGPVSGTTLAAGAVATLPAAPPATDAPAQTTDGQNVGGSGYLPGTNRGSV